MIGLAIQLLLSLAAGCEVAAQSSSSAGASPLPIQEPAGAGANANRQTGSEEAGVGTAVPPTASAAGSSPSAQAFPPLPADAEAPADRISPESLQEYAAELRAALPEAGYTVLVETPFVVIGNEAPERVRQHAERTIRWAVKHLQQDYFSRDPQPIVEIWLFGDKESYEAGCERLTGAKPGTPFGFYSAANRKLIMNIATGGGTLVHEIVHPFMAANFPGCPAWFNEGLASLYEQCGEEAGQITGYTNWRLRGLQLAISDQRALPIPAVVGTSTREFYGESAGLHYATARYLCLFLQERKLLREFYHRFRADAAEDPTGIGTLTRLLSVTDWNQFQTDWQSWVEQLQF